MPALKLILQAGGMPSHGGAGSYISTVNKLITTCRRVPPPPGNSMLRNAYCDGLHDLSLVVNAVMPLLAVGVELHHSACPQ